MLARLPAAVRFCTAVVDNFPMMLRVLFLAGALLLANDIRSVPGKLERQTADAVPASVVSHEESAPVEIEPPLMTEGVRQALACTYRAYREAHFDECVDVSSVIYERPDEDDDGTGNVPARRPMLLAALQNPGPGD